MRGRIWAVASLCTAFALLHCGGTVHVVPGGGGASGVGGGGHGFAGAAGHAGHAGALAGGGGFATRDAGFDAFTDPGCPDVGQPTEIRTCDPFSPVPNCPVGQGCFPFVNHPQLGDGCGAQTYGTECRPAGTGHQGDPCGSGGDSCASGFVCVVGSQPGKHCVQLCPLDGTKVCADGLICGELDVEGYGVCS